MSIADDMLKLNLCATSLGPRARRLLIRIAERLQKGAREHGDFDPKIRRNWRAEASEELLDATVYLTLDLLEASEEPLIVEPEPDEASSG